MATKKRAARFRRGPAHMWLVEPTPTILEILGDPKHPDHPALLEALGVQPEADTHEARQRAVDAIRKGAPIRMGGTVTRYPDPGGNPTLSIQADDVSVRAGGWPLRNPTAASGLAIAPAAAQVIADTGQLAAGTYYVELRAGFSAAAAAGKHVMFEHRNAANAAVINTLALCPGNFLLDTVCARVVVALNERIRALIGAVAAAAGEGAQAEIRAYRLDV